MDNAFIAKGERNNKQIYGVFFVNGSFDYSLLTNLSIQNAEVKRVIPVTKDPKTPTAYICDGSKVEKISLNWSGQITSSSTKNDSPNKIIPAVEGQAANETIYKPIGYLIKGVKRGKNPALGILVTIPKPGMDLMQADKKKLIKLGFEKITSMEKVKFEDKCQNDIFYLVDRDPSASEVDVKRLANDGSIIQEYSVQGDPSEILPKIDLPISFIPTCPPSRRSSIPPSTRRSKKRKRAF